MFVRAPLLGLLLVVSATAVLPLKAAEPKPVPGKVTDVTLYRGQALITRAVPLEGAKGSYELVVTDLPANVVEGSLYAESGDGVEVRAVRLRQRAVGEEPRDEVRKLDLQLLELNEQLQLNQKQTEVLTKRTQYLDNLETFVAATAKADLAKGLLNAESLEKLSTYSFTERQRVATEQIEMQKQQRVLQEQMQLAQQKRNEVASGSQTTVNEALLFLEKLAAGAETVRLNYLVSDCGWSPSYTLRAGKNRQEVELEYNALIHQLTGEDWSGVSLTLSTATPALSAAGPGVAPFYVALNRSAPVQTAAIDQAQGQQAAQQLAGQYKGVKEKQSDLNRKLQNSINLRDNLGFNWQLNSVANDAQAFELTNPREFFQGPGEEFGSTEGPSLSYRLATAVSLASRTDQQMIRIMKSSLPSGFYHVATPVISDYVYREAEIKNTSDQDLLGGPMTIYLEGRFVGRTESATVARGQTFIVGFGIDPQVRASRELLDRREGVQGGNRELSFKYRLGLENYAAEPVTLRLFDRLPHGEIPGEVRVTLAPPETPLSKDARYLRTERTKGILRWDLEVPAGANLEKSVVVEYGFTVDFDRSFALAPSRQAAEQQLEEFEQLQRGRMILAPSAPAAP